MTARDLKDIQGFRKNGYPVFSTVRTDVKVGDPITLSKSGLCRIIKIFPGSLMNTLILVKA